MGFQEKILHSNTSKAGHIRELAPLFFEDALRERFAAVLDINTLFSWFNKPETGEALLIASISHHGTPICFDPSDRTGNYSEAKTKWWRPKNGRDPFMGIAELLALARRVFPNAFSARNTICAPPMLQHYVAGLVMLADWIGSHQGFFPFDSGVAERSIFAQKAARQALKTIGLDAQLYRDALGTHALDFSTLLGVDQLRPLQEKLATWPVSDDNRLLILEAETGAGKTEAALARFLSLFAAGAVDGLYFALPTRVAARELYGRVLRTVANAFPDANCRPPVLLAVPSYARMDGIDTKLLLPSSETRWDDDAANAVRERAWAAQRPKRFLAATVAVGTIDQALLSVLPMPHAHLRAACLNRQLLVVDEVHASDPYMRQLLKQLLYHHLGIGGHALLLSATLGAVARCEWVTADGDEQDAEEDFATACAAPYPALTAGKQAPLALATGTPDKAVQVECVPLLADPTALLPRLMAALQNEARVLVVLNTVARVVALQRALENLLPAEALFHCNGVIAPHHGRFAAVDRVVLDEAVSARFGKGAEPGAALLIGTQTLEQSLDLDADLLVTDLCPMDVLLQRIGRLHRHNRPRPTQFARARCIVLVPEDATLESWLDKDGQGRGLAGLGSVYTDLRILRLTLDLLMAQPVLSIPSDNRRLIEGATHPEALATLNSAVWGNHAQIVDGTNLAQKIQASLVDLKHKPFGEFTFDWRNEALKTRLGLNDWRVHFEETVTSPFGQKLEEIVIPGHLAPAKPEEIATIVAQDARRLIFRCGGQYYCYSRWGLEKEEQ